MNRKFSRSSSRTQQHVKSETNEFQNDEGRQMEYWKIVIIIFTPPPPKMNFYAEVHLPLNIEKSTPNFLKFLNKIIVRFIQLMYLVSKDYGYVILNIVLNNAAWKK